MSMGWSHFLRSILSITGNHLACQKPTCTCIHSVVDPYFGNNCMKSLGVRHCFTFYRFLCLKSWVMGFMFLFTRRGAQFVLLEPWEHRLKAISFVITSAPSSFNTTCNMIHSKSSMHSVQISVTIAYVLENCTVNKMCWRSCLENVSYQVMLYKEDGIINSLETETPARKCTRVDNSLSMR